MKIRKFYPSQVLRNLSGKNVSGLAAADKAALKIALHRARKVGLAVTIVNDEIDVRDAKQLGQVILADIREKFGKVLGEAPLAPPLKTVIFDEF